MKHVFVSLWAMSTSPGDTRLRKAGEWDELFPQGGSPRRTLETLLVLDPVRYRIMLCLRLQRHRREVV